MRRADAADASQDLLYLYIFYYPDFAFITYLTHQRQKYNNVIVI